MKNEIDQFIRYLATERNVSGHTLNAYRSDLEQFREFLLRERGVDAGAEAVDHLLIRRYLALLHKGHKKSSIGRKLAAIRAFFKYLLRLGKVAKNPAELVCYTEKGETGSLSPHHRRGDRPGRGAQGDRTPYLA